MRIRGAIVVLYLLLAGSVAAAMEFSDWSWSVSLESVPGTDPALNTAFQDGCPAPSKDGLTLFTHTLAVTRDNFVAHDNLGVELDQCFIQS